MDNSSNANLNIEDESAILRDLENEWDSLKKRQKARGICSTTVNDQWKKLERRHRER